jgi:hypothetical protein
MKLINLMPLKELSPLRKSLMGIGKYDSEAETEFNAHHGGSMYGDHMGNYADNDTIDFDDEEKDRNPGKVVPYDPKKDKIKRGYEPITNISEMNLSEIIKELENPCWKGYEMVGMKKKDGREVPNCVPTSEASNSNAIGQPGGFYGDEEDTITETDLRDTDAEINYGTVEPEEYDVEDEDMADFIAFMRGYDKSLNEGCQCLREAEYQGREVQLGKPMQGDVKKFKVYVKNPAGNVVKVNFGQKGMKIRKSNPGARKNFRARMNCDNPGPRDKARYWSCRKW